MGLGGDYVVSEKNQVNNDDNNRQRLLSSVCEALPNRLKSVIPEHQLAFVQ